MIASRFFKVLSLLGIMLFSLTTMAAPNAQKDKEVKALPELKVCAVPQLYNVLERLKLSSPISFETTIKTGSELYADLVNTDEHHCDVLLSSDERLPLKLANTGKLDANNMKAFAKVKLLLWSPNPRLISQGTAEKLFTTKRLQSIALAKAELTPVGFASNEVLRHHKLKARFLKDHTYRAINEYQVYAMVNEGHVEAGFVTTPLIFTLTRQLNGSYWVVPEDYYPTIQYYATIMDGDQVPFAKAQQFIEFLTTDPKTIHLLEALGFFALEEKDK